MPSNYNDELRKRYKPTIDRYKILQQKQINKLNEIESYFNQTKEDIDNRFYYLLQQFNDEEKELNILRAELENIEKQLTPN